MAEKHIWDQVADDVVKWITTESQYYANAILGTSDAPFSQDVDQDQAKKYYQAQFFNPDGSENDSGRQKVLQRIGIENYIPLLKELEKGRKPDTSTEPPIPLQENAGVAAPTEGNSYVNS